MKDGRIVCPRCNQRTLPAIEPESAALAAKCQNPNCGSILKRKYFETLAALQETPDSNRKKLANP